MNSNVLMKPLGMGVLALMTLLMWTLRAAHSVDEPPKILWQKAFGAEVTSLTAVDDGRAVLISTRVRTPQGFEPNQLNFVDAKGQVRWTHLPIRENLGGDATSKDGRVTAVSEYFGDSQNNDAILGEDLVLLDRNGKLQWRRQTEPSIDLRISRKGDVIASVGTRTIQVFNSSPNSKAVLLWEKTFNVEQDFEAAALSADGSRVLAARDDSVLQLFGAKGQLLWQHKEQLGSHFTTYKGDLVASDDLRYVVARAQQGNSELRYFDTTQRTSWSVRLAPPSETQPVISELGLSAKGEAGLIVAYVPGDKTVKAERIYRFTQERQLIFLQEREKKGSIRAERVWVDDTGKQGAVLLSPLGIDARKQLMLIDMATGKTRLLELPPSQNVELTRDLRFAFASDSKGKVICFDLSAANVASASSG